MFSLAPDASKVALVRLADKLRGCGFSIIDAQVVTPHTEALGVEEWPREEFLEVLAKGGPRADAARAVDGRDDVAGALPRRARPTYG